MRTMYLYCVCVGTWTWIYIDDILWFQFVLLKKPRYLVGSGVVVKRYKRSFRSAVELPICHLLCIRAAINKLVDLS